MPGFGRIFLLPILLLPLLLILAGIPSDASAQSKGPQHKGGTQIEKRRDIASRPKKSGLRSAKGDAIFLIKNVDITRFPEMSVIFSAVDNRNVFIRTLKAEDIIVEENGIRRPIISLDLVSAANRVPIDIVFVIDQTASMRDLIGTVKENVNAFADQLRQHGFDFRLGLIRFSDVVDWNSHDLTDEVDTFERWVGDINVVGGGDLKENALEALHAISTMKLRPIAIRMAVLITDAQYHQQYELGDGLTDFTTQSMGDYLYEREVRLLTVSPAAFPEFHELAQLTEGSYFDLGESFHSVLNGLVGDITSLYALKYLSQSTLAPDSVRITILRADDQSPLATRKLLAMEPGRRFVFEDLQFAPNQASLTAEFIPELERVVRLMHVRPTLRIKIEGHADSTGLAEINMSLSLQRAEAVKRYLMQSGIPGDRLETEGFGSSRPLLPNNTEAGRRTNRRTEFLILSK